MAAQTSTPVTPAMVGKAYVEHDHGSGGANVEAAVVVEDVEAAVVGLPWSVEKSANIYKVEGWGEPYFKVNKKGHMSVHPHGQETLPEEGIDLMDVVEDALLKKGMRMPLIIRFPDILKHRVETLQRAFVRGIAARQYKGVFRGVFPVKCNPDRRIVEDIVAFGKDFDYGLEAGSKPELLTVMSCMCKASPSAMLICNGYKDYEYVALALTARDMKLNAIIVLEQVEEVEVVIKASQELGVRPVIGLRAKLNTKHGGHWGETSGDDGKFGLSIPHIMRVVDELRTHGMLECLQLLHFHIGSQIPSLEVVQEGVAEAAHLFCGLALMGADMRIIDIGGGLGVDYDGSHDASSDMSVGYTMEQYAEEVVGAIGEACSLKNVKHPVLCCESGRGIVSHQSVLVFDVFSGHHKGVQGSRAARSSAGTGEWHVPDDIICTQALPQQILCMHQDLKASVDCFAALECSAAMRTECARLFSLGLVSLQARAAVETIHEEIVAAVKEAEHNKQKCVAQAGSFKNEYDASSKVSGQGSNPVNAIYHVNLSVFKSMPDYWAIDQLFPIVPLHRLEEEPTSRAVFSDLTCDSDGKVSSFIGRDAHGVQKRYLEVHALQPGRAYIMGMFLAGAYQEILGGMHNLFGNTNIVHVLHKKKDVVHDPNYEIGECVQGQAVADVMRLMQHDPDSMLEVLKRRVEESRREASPNDSDIIMSRLDRTFRSYTYLANEQRF